MNETYEKKIENIREEIIAVLGLFDHPPKIHISFSGGKDSIVMWDLFKKSYNEWGGDWHNVVMTFFDEEAMFDGVIKCVENTREELISYGGTFNWFCMPFRHYSAIDSLKVDDVYLLWKESERENWVRPMPEFAIKNYKGFVLGMNYQEFSNNVYLKDLGCDLQLQGMRIFESIQRRQDIGSIKNRYKITGNGRYTPIRYLTEKDIWRYIDENKLDFPMEYLFLYQTKGQAGRRHNGQLRISQLFSSDTIETLTYLREFDPDLWKRIEKRQPNAYLASLYFGNTFSKDTEYDPNECYFDLILPHVKNRKSGKKVYIYMARIKQLGIENDERINKWCHKYYKNVVVKGDPKGRSARSLRMTLYNLVDKVGAEYKKKGAGTNGK